MTMASELALPSMVMMPSPVTVVATIVRVAIAV
jgi:hypothetical protein